MKESVFILMQMAPTAMDIKDIEKRLTQETSLKNIHHIHLWKLTDKLIHFECHIDLEKDLRVSETREIF